MTSRPVAVVKRRSIGVQVCRAARSQPRPGVSSRKPPHLVMPRPACASDSPTTNKPDASRDRARDGRDSLTSFVSGQPPETLTAGTARRRGTVFFAVRLSHSALDARPDSPRRHRGSRITSNAVRLICAPGTPDARGGRKSTRSPRIQTRTLWVNSHRNHVRLTSHQHY